MGHKKWALQGPGCSVARQGTEFRELWGMHACAPPTLRGSACAGMCGRDACIIHTVCAWSWERLWRA